MRTLTLEECHLVSGGGDPGGNPGGNPPGDPRDDPDGGGTPLTNPFPEQEDQIRDDGRWDWFYNQPYGSSGEVTTTGVSYTDGDGRTVAVGTIDDQRDPGSVNGGQVTITIPF